MYRKVLQVYWHQPLSAGTAVHHLQHFSVLPWFSNHLFQGGSRGTLPSYRWDQIHGRRCWRRHLGEEILLFLIVLALNCPLTFLLSDQFIGTIYQDILKREHSLYATSDTASVNLFLPFRCWSLRSTFIAPGEKAVVQTAVGWVLLESLIWLDFFLGLHSNIL